MKSTCCDARIKSHTDHDDITHFCSHCEREVDIDSDDVILDRYIVNYTYSIEESVIVSAFNEEDARERVEGGDFDSDDIVESLFNDRPEQVALNGYTVTDEPERVSDCCDEEIDKAEGILSSGKHYPMESCSKCGKEVS